MPDNEQLQLFEDQPIRTAWDEEKEEWYFSVVDVVGVLTDQPDARHASTYWAVLKKRLKAQGAGQLGLLQNRIEKKPGQAAEEGCLTGLFALRLNCEKEP